MFERRRHALVAGMTLLGVAVVLTIVVAADRTGSVLQAADDRWLACMRAIRTPWLTRAARTMSVLGGPLVMVPLRLTVITALAWRRRWLQLGAFLGATVTSELCIGPLKALIDRPRPPLAMVATDSPSFPSGHAIASAVTAIGLVVVLVPAASRRTRWTVVAALFALLMAMSRTYLGAHWASDVVAGACIGTGLAVVWSAGLEMERARRRAAVGRDAAGERTWMASSLRRASLVLQGVGLACIVALHVLRRDLAPSGHRISEYAIGPYGALMAVAFVAIGLGLLALGAAIAASTTDRPAAVVAAIIAAAGLGMVASGIWRTDPGRSGATTDAIHSAASAFATLALIVAAVGWSAVRRRGRHHPDVGAVLAVMAAVLGALSPALHRSSWTGVSQRLLWLTLLAWLMVTAWRLTPSARRDVRDPSGTTVTVGS
jgi:undecaprenyl-diphosphatase